MTKRFVSGILTFVLGSLVSTILFAEGNVKRGEKKYKVCVACHGENGGGLKITNAPRIAGQESWYLARQLYNFKNGIRGSHLKDITGLQMRPMAMSLFTDQDVEDVVSYIETLNGRGKHLDLEGDIDAGKKAYAVCVSCHGSNGEGNKALNSPKIAGLPDWYVERQLYKFRQGIRGVHPKDIYGQQMRPMAISLANDEVVRNVTVYLASLKRIIKPKPVAIKTSPKLVVANTSLSEPLYAPCASCHGVDGEGNQKLGAPRLAGQQKWYIERQLRNWREGIRGTHSKDIYGIQMRPMAMTLLDDVSLKKVVDFIGTLKGASQESTINGNLELGKTSYKTCIACHGSKGEGNIALNAPKIAGLPDWYIARQLHSFRSGIRGTHKKDVYGMQMRPMAMALKDEQSISDVATYIASFSEEIMEVYSKPSVEVAIKSDTTSVNGSVENGKALYTTCASCHGENGEGNTALNAPRISGQQDWYIARQLHSFKKGLRGSHEKDIYGQQMRPMSMTLTSDQAIQDVTAYVNTLKGTASEPTLKADASSGKVLYAVCASCHGSKGEGNKALNAPAIAGQQDWYIARQLYNFKNGIRGSHPEDTYGQQMRPMAMSLSDDTAIANIAAFISALE